MRFLITANPCENDARAEAEKPLDEGVLSAYMKYNEEMHRAGVLIAAEGLYPDAKPVRVTVSAGKRSVVDGPFTESKELLGGLYVLEVASEEEAIRWALRHPVGLGTDDVLEIRRLTALADLPPRVRELIAASAPTWSTSVERRG
jgi:hypothetical protein